MATRFQYVDEDEAKIVTDLVNKILAAGYQILYFDPEAKLQDQLAAVPTSSADEVLDALGAMEDEHVVVYTMDRTRLGFIQIIWGNGEDVIADHTDTPIMCDLVG